MTRNWASKAPDNASRKADGEPREFILDLVDDDDDNAASDYDDNGHENDAADYDHHYEDDDDSGGNTDNSIPSSLLSFVRSAEQTFDTGLHEFMVHANREHVAADIQQQK